MFFSSHFISESFPQQVIGYNSKCPFPHISSSQLILLHSTYQHLAFYLFTSLFMVSLSPKRKAPWKQKILVLFFAISSAPKIRSGTQYVLNKYFLKNEWKRKTKLRRKRIWHEFCFHFICYLYPQSSALYFLFHNTCFQLGFCPFWLLLEYIICASHCALWRRKYALPISRSMRDHGFYETCSLFRINLGTNLKPPVLWSLSRNACCLSHKSLPDTIPLNIII